jgi:hypothetical protein
LAHPRKTAGPEAKATEPVVSTVPLARLAWTSPCRPGRRPACRLPIGLTLRCLGRLGFLRDAPPAEADSTACAAPRSKAHSNPATRTVNGARC